MATCDNCGTFVTATYARVFGDNDGSVQGCPDCTALRYLTEGGTASDADADTQSRQWVPEI